MGLRLVIGRRMECGRGVAGDLVNQERGQCGKGSSGRANSASRTAGPGGACFGQAQARRSPAPPTDLCSAAEALPSVSSAQAMAHGSACAIAQPRSRAYAETRRRGVARACGVDRRRGPRGEHTPLRPVPAPHTAPCAPKLATAHTAHACRTQRQRCRRLGLGGSRCNGHAARVPAPPTR